MLAQGREPYVRAPPRSKSKSRECFLPSPRESANASNADRAAASSAAVETRPRRRSHGLRSEEDPNRRPGPDQMHRAGLNRCLGPGGPGEWLRPGRARSQATTRGRPLTPRGRLGADPAPGTPRPVHRPGPRPPRTCSDTTAYPHPTTHARGPVRHVRTVTDLDHQRIQEGSPGRTPPTATR